MPGIEIESEQIGPELAVEEETTSGVEQAMDAACNTNLIDKNITTKAPALVDEVIYIYGDKVKDLIYDTVKEEESRTDEIIKTENIRLTMKNSITGSIKIIFRQ